MIIYCGCRAVTDLLIRELVSRNLPFGQHLGCVVEVDREDIELETLQRLFCEVPEPLNKEIKIIRSGVTLNYDLTEEVKVKS